MKRTITILLVFIFLASAAFAQSANVSVKDLLMLEGKLWVGNLTYLDYTSKKQTVIRSNLAVSRSPSDPNVWIFDLQYPLEPKANSKDEVRLRRDGRTFDGETVIERTELEGGIVKIVTTKEGKDDNRDATVRHTYLIGRNSFSITKEVRFDGTGDFFERNTYSWTR